MSLAEILEEIRAEAGTSGSTPGRRPLVCPKCATVKSWRLSPVVKVSNRHRGRVTTITLPRTWQCSFCHFVMEIN
jgi:rubredoxin